MFDFSLLFFVFVFVADFCFSCVLLLFVKMCSENLPKDVEKKPQRLLCLGSLLLC